MNLTRRAALLGSAAICTGMSPAQRAVILGGGLPGTGPSLSLDFTTGALDPSITFTRASAGWYFDATGVLRSASNDVPRFDYGPPPAGVTNYIRNNSMVGAAAGSPGTAPTNWGTIDGLTVASSGISANIVAVGTEAGIPYIDVRWQGTASATSLCYCRMESSTQIAAVNAQTWTGSIHLRLVGGSLANLTCGMFLGERNSVGASTVVVHTPTTPTNGTLATQRLAATHANTDPTTAFELLASYISFANGAVIDVTLRIGAPQLEIAPSAGALVLTTIAAVTAYNTPAGVTNWLRNNSMVGAVPGTPGTPPTNWFGTWPAGITAQIVSLPTVGGMPGIRWSLTGTPGGGASVYQFDNIQFLPTTPGVNWTASMFVQLNSGSFTTGYASFDMTVREYDASQAFIRQTTTSFNAITSLTRVISNLTTGAGTYFILLGIRIAGLASVPAATDFTIAGPQVELAPVAGPVVLTTGSPANVGAVPLGLLIEETRTNSIRNSSGAGAVVGTPGTLPTNWSVTPLGTTTSVVAFGTENGIPYVDIRFNGTTTSAAQLAVGFESPPATAVAAQQWTGSAHCRLIAGSFANITNLGVQVNVAGGTGQTRSPVVPTFAPLASQRTQCVVTTGAGATGVTVFFVGSVVSGVAIDFTIRIGAPQLELGAFATSPILTTSAAVTRAVETASMPWVSGAALSLAVEAEADAPPGSATGQIATELDDGSTNNRIILFRNPSTGASTAQFMAGGVSLFNPSQEVIAQGATYKSIISRGSSTSNFCTNGGVVASSGAAGTIPPSTNLRFGSNTGPLAQLNGRLRRVRYWPRVLSNAELQAATAITPSVGTATGFITAGGTLAFTGAHDATGASYLIAAIGISSPAAYTPIATYNGVTMTLLGTRNDGAGAMWVWGLRNPIAGSNTLSISAAGFAGSAGVIAFNVAGTSSTPIGAVATGILPAVAGGGPGTVNITQTRASSLIIGIATQSFDPPPATPSGSPAPTPIITQLSADTHGSAAAAYQVGGPAGTVIGTTWTPVWNPMYLATIEVLPT